MKKIYAIPNYECSLDCPHCDIHRKHLDYCRNAFISQLKKLENESRVTLFGGEPTLFKDRFIDICSNAKIASISTNLLDVDDDIISILSRTDISIATSWNMTRFTQLQFDKWLGNLRKLSSMRHDIMVLVTMTPDLIADSSMQTVLDVLEKIDQAKSVSKVLFEHLVSSTATNEFHSRCDDWLCQMHKVWNFSFSNEIEQKVKDWKFDCSNVYTIDPSGNIHPGCPQYNEHPILNRSCLKCSNVTKCHPCALQSSCTFPKKLFSLVSAKQ